MFCSMKNFKLYVRNMNKDIYLMTYTGQHLRVFLKNLNENSLREKRKPSSRLLQDTCSRKWKKFY